GTLHESASGGEASIGSPLQTQQPDSRTAAAQVDSSPTVAPPPDSSPTVAPHEGFGTPPRPDGYGVPQLDGAADVPRPGETAGPVPRGDGLGVPLAGEGIDPAERTPRSFHLSRGLLERARAAAFWVAQLPDRSEPTNISELVERALHSEVERLEQAYNNGTPFPAVVGRMRTGPGASGVERIRRAQRARRRQAPAGSTEPDPGHT
ncbi:MAG: ParB family protein, partial [Micromonosporaceae bacterium]